MTTEGKPEYYAQWHASLGRLVDHFGEIWEQDKMLETLKILKDGHEKDLTVRELHEILADKMLIVGGDNEVGKKQFNVALMAYLDAKPVWDYLISGYEELGGFKGHRRENNG